MANASVRGDGSRESTHMGDLHPAVAHAAVRAVLSAG